MIVLSIIRLSRWFHTIPRLVVMIKADYILSITAAAIVAPHLAMRRIWASSNSDSALFRIKKAQKFGDFRDFHGPTYTHVWDYSGGQKSMALTVNEEIRSRVTYSVILPRLGPEATQAFVLAQLDRAGLGHNTFSPRMPWPSSSVPRKACCGAPTICA